MYSALNNTLSWGTGPVRLHAGLHLITLHQVTGQVMAADSYMTWQTTIDTLFLEALKETQDGRLLVILGAVSVKRNVIRLLGERPNILSPLLFSEGEG